MRSLVCVLILTFVAACRPVAEARCLDVEWTLAIEDAEIWSLCDVQIAPDGTVVMLVGTSSMSLIEVEPDGSGWRRLDLPFADAAGRPSCGELAISPDGERWATSAVLEEEDPPTLFTLSRVSAAGEPSTTTLGMPGVQRWAPTSLVFDGDLLRVGGFATTDQLGDASAWFSFMGVINRRRSALEIQQELPALRSVHALVPRPKSTMYALVGEPNIDWSDMHLLAIDSETGTIDWQRVVGQTPDAPSDAVLAAVEVGERDIAILRRLGTSTVIERYGPTSDRAWAHEHDWGRTVVGQVAAATPEHVVAIAEVGADLEVPNTSQAAVIDVDGNFACATALPLPASDRHRTIHARSGDRNNVIVATDFRDDTGRRGVWVAEFSLAQP